MSYAKRVLNVKALRSKHFLPGERPSWSLLFDYKPSCGLSFAALVPALNWAGWLVVLQAAGRGAAYNYNTAAWCHNLVTKL